MVTVAMRRITKSIPVFSESVLSIVGVRKVPRGTVAGRQVSVCTSYRSSRRPESPLPSTGTVLSSGLHVNGPGLCWDPDGVVGSGVGRGKELGQVRGPGPPQLWFRVWWGLLSVPLCVPLLLGCGGRLSRRRRSLDAVRSCRGSGPATRGEPHFSGGGHSPQGCPCSDPSCRLESPQAAHTSDHRL